LKIFFFNETGEKEKQKMLQEKSTKSDKFDKFDKPNKLEKCDSNPISVMFALVFFLTTILFAFLYTMLHLKNKKLVKQHTDKLLFPEFDIVCPKDKYCVVSDLPINYGSFHQELFTDYKQDLSLPTKAEVEVDNISDCFEKCENDSSCKGFEVQAANNQRLKCLMKNTNDTQYKFPDVRKTSFVKRKMNSKSASGIQGKDGSLTVLEKIK
jgi:hypothetical protein